MHRVAPALPNERVTKNRRDAAPTVDPLKNREFPAPDGTAAYVTTSAMKGITTDSPNTTATTIALAEEGNPGTDAIRGTSRKIHHKNPSHIREVIIAKP
jgi:hypothetical protein